MSVLLQACVQAYKSFARPLVESGLAFPLKKKDILQIEHVGIIMPGNL